MLTKKRVTLLVVVMSIVYFFLLFFFLPEKVTESRMENVMFFSVKLGFLSFTAAISTSVALIFVFRREFIHRQVESIKRFRYLLMLLVKRDFVARYRRSVLGVLWSLLNPLLTMLIMTMVFSYIFNRQIDNYPVYLLSGLILFNFFNESTTQAMNSLILNSGIIRKVYVPKYIFPVSRVLSSLVNLLFSFIAFFIVFIFTRATFHWTILFIPIPIIYTLAFSLGVGLIMSSLAVFFRDLLYLYSVFLTMMTYLTPILYPASAVPEWVQSILGVNPLYHFIDYFRSLVLRGELPGVWSNMVCIGFCLAALCGGLYVFMSQQDNYILYL